MSRYRKTPIRLRLAWVLVGCLLGSPQVTEIASAETVRRVPAEWEPQAGVWLQWPGPWERSYETAFARISSVIVGYQPLHILYGSLAIQSAAKNAIRQVGANPDDLNIHWHAVS